MAAFTSPGYQESSRENIISGGEGHSSGVSWGAVLGGAFVIASSSLILLALGAGFELSAVSPWSNIGAYASTVSAMSIVWLIVVEVIAAALGGYLTGRLRTKWTMIHDDEVYFRDTANGFLAWAVALVVSATFMASAGASMVGRAPQQPVAAGESDATSMLREPTAYFVDALFRPDRTQAAVNDTPVRQEAGRILANAIRRNQMSAADQSYLAGLVASRTGISQTDSQQRVSNVLADARQAEDSARKATAHFLLWLFLALLTGALSASYAAVIGGRQRDGVKAV